MAWHNKKSHASSALAPKTAPKEDEKVAKLKAALDKINDPPPMERLVGAVIHADGKVEDQRPASHLEVKPPEIAPLTQPKPTTPSQKLPPDRPKPIAVQPPLSPIKPATQNVGQNQEKLDPLVKIELLAHGVFIKQQKKQQTPQAVMTPVITPTNPDPDAVIPAHIAEKKRAQEQKVAEEEAKKWNVTKAAISETKLNKRKMYTYTCYWLGAVPVAFIMYTIVQAIGGDNLRGVSRFLLMTPIYVVGSYGLIGWIPLVLEYLKTQKG